jgi:hypothetical protein
MLNWLLETLAGTFRGRSYGPVYFKLTRYSFSSNFTRYESRITERHPAFICHVGELSTLRCAFRTRFRVWMTEGTE